MLFVEGCIHRQPACGPFLVGPTSTLLSKGTRLAPFRVSAHPCVERGQRWHNLSSTQKLRKFKECQFGAGEMAWLLRALAALPKYLEFDFQHLHGGLHLSITLSLRIWSPLLEPGIHAGIKKTLRVFCLETESVYAQAGLELEFFLTQALSASIAGTLCSNLVVCDSSLWTEVSPSLCFLLFILSSHNRLIQPLPTGRALLLWARDANYRTQKPFCNGHCWSPVTSSTRGPRQLGGPPSSTPAIVMPLHTSCPMGH